MRCNLIFTGEWLVMWLFEVDIQNGMTLERSVRTTLLENLGDTFFMENGNSQNLYHLNYYKLILDKNLQKQTKMISRYKCAVSDGMVT